VGFGARGVPVEVSSLKLFRDVYYTDDVGRRAIDGAAQLKSNEYFVLGDNSPVSKDSRSWTNATVLTGEMLLGKPLVVHLPSRKRRFHFGSWQTEIRIPEVSRIRYIH
jgi:signal peptidase I